MSGIASFLKTTLRNVVVVGVEPKGSAVFGGEYVPYLQNGAGLSFQPGNLIRSVVDRVLQIPDGEAFEMCRRVATSEGLELGGSSGAVLRAAEIAGLEIASRLPGKACRIVTILPDGGEKYRESIYSDAWMVKHGFDVGGMR